MAFERYHVETRLIASLPEWNGHNARFIALMGGDGMEYLPAMEWNIFPFFIMMMDGMDSMRRDESRIGSSQVERGDAINRVSTPIH